MYVVKTSPRALLVALVPLAALHAALFAMALLETQVDSPVWSLPAPDKVFLVYCRQLAIEAALLFAGHLLLRQRRMCSRMAYALTGAGMIIAAYALSLQNGWLLAPPPSGSELTAGLLPAVAGAIAGFLYGQFAGLELIGDLPHAAMPRFEGPVRVRTSVAAIAIASTIPAVLSSILLFAFNWYFFVHAMPPGAFPEAMPPKVSFILAAALPAQLFLTTLIATTLPAAILVLVAHHVVRAVGSSSGLHYALAGAALGALSAAATASFTRPLLSVPLYVTLLLGYGALMGGLYRRFAGLEPVPLPEPVIATDPDALVGTDHASRRSHVVITGQ